MAMVEQHAVADRINPSRERAAAVVATNVLEGLLGGDLNQVVQVHRRRAGQRAHARMHSFVELPLAQSGSSPN